MSTQTIQQSVAWWCFVPTIIAPEPFVRAVAEAGYSAIELVPPEYWSLVKSYGLAISAIGGHAPLEVGLNQREQHQHIEASIVAALAEAERMGIPNLICFSGNRNGISDAEGAAITAEGLQRVARAAESSGVTLALELLNSKVDHPDYQADHTAWGVDVCQMVNSPRVKLLYDIYHMQIMEGDLIRTIRAAHPFIGHYHTAGNPGRHDLDTAQEICYPAVLQTIADTGYTGYVTHEFIPKGDPHAALRDTYMQCMPYL